MDTKFWIVGRYQEQVGEFAAWAFQGIYSTEENARKACLRRNDFYAPAILDEEPTEEHTVWEGCVYPHCEP
jgi:hypothetical protein